MKRFKSVEEIVSKATLDNLIVTLQELANFVPGQAKISTRSNFTGGLVVEAEWETDSEGTPVLTVPT